MQPIYGLALSGFSEGLWFILTLGFITCGSSVVQKHPYAYNEQLISNFTTTDNLEASNGEVTDTITKQAPLEISTEEYVNNNDEYPDVHNNTQTDLSESSGFPYNATVNDFILTQYNVTENTSSSEGFKMTPVSNSAFNTGIIIGISLLVVIVAVLVGAISYILYRHNMWNRPQTLQSDKCSNDESTGYIDDTFRENSEEMYSLDNDSFLNSLEAMTIQNYWTDHVKHTKL